MTLPWFLASCGCILQKSMMIVHGMAKEVI